MVPCQIASSETCQNHHLLPGLVAKLSAEKINHEKEIRITADEWYVFKRETISSFFFSNQKFFRVKIFNHESVGLKISSP